MFFTCLNDTYEKGRNIMPKMGERAKGAMRKFVKKILRVNLGLDKILKELELKNMLELSPADQFIFSHHEYFTQGHYHKHYPEWRMRRINKILEIYGTDYFKGKRVLELGGGLGDIGAFFAELGAEVLSLEGRACNRNIANLRYRNLKNFKSVDCDLESDFSDLGRFDLVINFGVIEIIQNIDNVLDCCMKLSDEIVLETMVCDSSNPDKIVFVDMDIETIDGPLNEKEKGARPSPAYLENYFAKNDFSVTRYFTPDLTTTYLASDGKPHHVYDWTPKDDNSITKRRFWRFKKIKQSIP